STSRAANSEHGARLKHALKKQPKQRAFRALQCATTSASATVSSLMMKRINSKLFRLSESTCRVSCWRMQSRTAIPTTAKLQPWQQMHASSQVSPKFKHSTKMVTSKSPGDHQQFTTIFKVN